MNSLSTKDKTKMLVFTILYFGYIFGGLALFIYTFVKLVSIDDGSRMFAGLIVMIILGFSILSAGRWLIPLLDKLLNISSTNSYSHDKNLR